MLSSLEHRLCVTNDGEIPNNCHPLSPWGDHEEESLAYFKPALVPIGLPSGCPLRRSREQSPDLPPEPRPAGGGALAKPELGSPAVIVAVTTPAMMPRCVSACRAHGPRRIPARKGRCRFFPPLNKTEAPEGLAHSPGSLGQGRKLSPWERQMFGRLAAMTEFLFLFFFPSQISFLWTERTFSQPDCPEGLSVCAI